MAKYRDLCVLAIEISRSKHGKLSVYAHGAEQPAANYAESDGPAGPGLEPGLRPSTHEEHGADQGHGDEFTRLAQTKVSQVWAASLEPLTGQRILPMQVSLCRD
jgi:hypothetical protein